MVWIERLCSRRTISLRVGVGEPQYPCWSFDLLVKVQEQIEFVSRDSSCRRENERTNLSQ